MPFLDPCRRRQPFDKLRANGVTPAYIHAGRLIAVPGQAARGPSTIIVDGDRIVAVLKSVDIVMAPGEVVKDAPPR